MKWKVIHCVSILPQSICLPVMERTISLTQWEPVIPSLNLWGQSSSLTSGFSLSLRLSRMDFFLNFFFLLWTSQHDVFFPPLGEIEYWLSLAALPGLPSEGRPVGCHVWSCALPPSVALLWLRAVCLHKCGARGGVPQRLSPDWKSSEGPLVAVGVNYWSLNELPDWGSLTGKSSDTSVFLSFCGRSGKLCSVGGSETHSDRTTVSWQRNRN